LYNFAKLNYIVNITHEWEPEPGYWLPDWMRIHESNKNYSKLHKNKINVIFIGASIASYWKADGKHWWDSYYLPKGAANYGVPEDNTSNVLWRIRNNELDGLNPKLIVVTSGPGMQSFYIFIIDTKILNLYYYQCTFARI
jgi:hypothetical protein